MALIYEDMEWTKPLRQGLEGVSPPLADVYRQLGMDVVYESTISLDQKMFTSIFEEAAASGAEVIDCAIGYIDEGAFIKQWAQSSAKDIAGHHLGRIGRNASVLDVTQGQCLGVMVGSSMVRVPITDKTIPFMDNLYTKYKMGAIFGSHTTYDTLYGLKKALETGRQHRTSPNSSPAWRTSRRRLSSEPSAGSRNSTITCPGRNTSPPLSNGKKRVTAGP